MDASLVVSDFASTRGSEPVFHKPFSMLIVYEPGCEAALMDLWEYALKYGMPHDIVLQVSMWSPGRCVGHTSEAA